MKCVFVALLLIRGTDSGVLHPSPSMMHLFSTNKLLANLHHCCSISAFYGHSCCSAAHGLLGCGSHFDVRNVTELVGALTASFSCSSGEVTAINVMHAPKSDIRPLIDCSGEVANFVRRATQGTFFSPLNDVFSPGSGQAVHYGAVEYLQCRGLDALPSISHVSA